MVQPPYGVARLYIICRLISGRHNNVMHGYVNIIPRTMDCLSGGIAVSRTFQTKHPKAGFSLSRIKCTKKREPKTCAWEFRPTRIASNTINNEPVTTVSQTSILSPQIPSCIAKAEQEEKEWLGVLCARQSFFSVVDCVSNG